MDNDDEEVMEEVEEDDEKEDTTTASGDDATNDEKNEEDDDELAKEETKVLLEAEMERKELMAAEQKKIVLNQGAASKEDRLQYLLKSSDVFAHFLAGSVAASGKGKKSGKTGGGKSHRGRLTEAEEDAQLLKSAQSKRRTVRLDKQPTNLASHCKMHSCQLEGLNWLIKLHDHGVLGKKEER